MRLFILLLISTSTYASDQCSRDSAKWSFVETCTGYLVGVGLRSGENPDRDKIKEECRCAAINFAVENLVLSDCNYNYNDVYNTMKVDAVRLRCR